MKIFDKLRIDNEKISNQKLKIERINENIVSNKMPIDNFKRKNKINYEKKETDEAIVMAFEDNESKGENELVKCEKEKLINENYNNHDLKVFHQPLISLKKIASNDIKIKSINTHDIKERRDLKIDKLKEIPDQKTKNNIIEAILRYQDIFIFLIIIKLYISNLTYNLNFELNWLLILQYITFYLKNIILIIIIEKIKFSIEINYRIILRRALTYIDEGYRDIINSIKKTFFLKRAKEFFKIVNINGSKKLKNDDNKFEGKQEQKINNYLIKNYIDKNNYIKTAVIKFFLMINLFYRIKSNTYELYFFQVSKITLKIKGNGENSILNQNFNYNNYLKEVYINGDKQDEKASGYIFNKEDNFVELIFNDNINNTNDMFKECTSITEINLSNFDTSSVTSMDNMFEGCLSLTSINLSNLKTSLVKRMIFMFSRCASLTSLDLSSFDTSSVSRMDSMFSHCSSLTTLNLSNFKSSLLTSYDSMFLNCINLEYINLYNFNEGKLKQNMFENLPNNLVICIKGNMNHILYNICNNTSYNKSYSDIIKKKCFIIDCSEDWKTKQKKIINNSDECIESCQIKQQYKYEYNGKCYEQCSNGFLDDNKCKCELDKCLLCPQVALNKGLCTKCNTNYYPKENDLSNLGEYINCYKELEGYYLDNNLYKKCYETCKTCNTKGNHENHSCLTCHINFPFIIKKNNGMNCYANCTYYYYNKENNSYCTMNLSCPDDYPNLNLNNRKCYGYFSVEDVIKDLLNIENNGIKKSKIEEIKYYDNILKSIENIFISENYDTSKLENGKDEVIKLEKMIISFTTSTNQRNNINNNMTSIDLGECETLLRSFYNLSNNETLYMKKIDIVQEGTKALKVEYDVFCKLSGTNLVKLNLTVCGKSKVSISVPIAINDHIDKLNTSSGYYNDICYTTTSEDGTDISLKDRKSDYANTDKIVCQQDCDFSEYNYDNNIAKCSCDVKESSSSFADMNINKEKLLANFKDIKNIANINFLICYEKLFTKEGIINNIGYYLILFIIFFHILSIFIFIIYSFRSIKKKIKRFASNMSNAQLTTVFIFNNENKKNKGKICIFNKNSLKNRKIINRIIKNNGISKFIKSGKDKIRIKEKYIDEEINGLSYNLAIKYDKRSYWQYYGSLLKTQHNLISAFFHHKDYNSGIIKKDLFLIVFVIEYTVNALFYNDYTMHEIYEKKGQFDIEAQLPIILYSTIISYILNTPLNFLALSNDLIIAFKQLKIENESRKKSKKLVKILKVKFTLYFIISFLFLLFFWYYISMFGVIYKNTQIHLLKDTLMSFGLSLFFPFLIYLLPGFLRIPAISSRKKDKKFLYNLSKVLQSF